MFMVSRTDSDGREVLGITLSFDEGVDLMVNTAAYTGHVIATYDETRDRKHAYMETVIVWPYVGFSQTCVMHGPEYTVHPTEYTIPSPVDPRLRKALLEEYKDVWTSPLWHTPHQGA